MVVIVAVNWLAVLASGIAAIVIGSVWYGPLFGKQWMALNKMSMPKTITPEIKKQMMVSYAVMFVATLVMATVLTYMLAYAGATTVVDALRVAFWCWLGFIATVMIGLVLWEQKPFKLYVLNVAHYLVSLVVMAIIIVTLH